MLCKVKNIECSYAHHISFNGDPLFNEPLGLHTRVVCLAPGGIEQCKRTNMEDFIKSMIEEHSQLIIRIAVLDDYVYSERSDNDNKVEFANKCIQLSAMKKYEEALRARLENQGIVFTDGEYFNKVAEVALSQEHDQPEETTQNGEKSDE